MVVQTHGEPAEQGFGKWFDDFRDMVSHGIIARRSKDYNAWSIPAWWVQLQAGRYAAKGPERGGEPHRYIEAQALDPRIQELRVGLRGFPADILAVG